MIFPTIVILLCLFIACCVVFIVFMKNQFDNGKVLLPADQHKLRMTSGMQMKKSPVMNSKSGSKTVYLTFDDGPSQWTNEILDILQKYGIQATFFMVGNNLEKSEFHHSVRRANKEGHYIGAHSMTHDYDILYKQREFVSEMEQTIRMIEKITNTSPNLVRAPYGSLPGLRDDVILSQIRNTNMKIWDWTIDTEDWQNDADEKKILKTLRQNVQRDIEVILLHEKEQTLKALPRMIHYLIDQGYSFEVYQEDNHFSNNFLGDDQL